MLGRGSIAIPETPGSATGRVRSALTAIKSGRQDEDEDEADDRRGLIRDHGHRDRRTMCSNRVGFAAVVAWKLDERVVRKRMFLSSSSPEKGIGQ